MNKITNSIKRNNGLYCFGIKARNRIPRKLYYPKDYFKIKRLLNLKDLNKLNIEDYRNEKLCNLLKEVLEYVPYYKKLNLGIKSGDVTEDSALKILNEFPYLDKEIVIQNPSEFINTKYKPNKLIRTASSCYKGPVTDLWRSRKENLLEKCFFDYNWGKLGYKNNSKIVAISWERLEREHEYPFLYAGDKLRICPNHMNNTWMKEIFNKIKEFKPEFIQAYPSCFQLLLQYIKDNKLKLHNVKGVFLDSEAITENLLNLSKSVFKDVPVIFNYELSERSNLAWGIFENSKICYKCDDIYGYSENFVNDCGFPEIIGTSYWNYAMPLIRYNTHDIGKIENGIIKNIDGRAQEFLISKQGDKIPGISICIDKFIWKYVYAVQVVQNDPGNIEFHVKPKDSFNLNIKEKILKSQREQWGNMFDILVVIDQRISKTESGRVRQIINNIR